MAALLTKPQIPKFYSVQVVSDGLWGPTAAHKHYDVLDLCNRIVSEQS